MKKKKKETSVTDKRPEDEPREKEKKEKTTLWNCRKQSKPAPMLATHPPALAMGDGENNCWSAVLKGSLGNRFYHASV